MKTRSHSVRRGGLTRSLLASSLSLALLMSAESAMARTCTTIGTTVNCTGTTTVLDIPPYYVNNTNNLTVNFSQESGAGALLGFGAAVLLSGNNVTLNNAGTIDPNLLGVLSVLTTGTIVGNGANASNNTINNDGSMYGGYSLVNVGLLNGTGAAVDIRNASGGTSNLVNNGTIGAGNFVNVNVLGNEGAAIVSSGGGVVNLENNGTIFGKVALQSSTAPGGLGNTVVNRGNIYGSVYMGDGNDYFVQDLTLGEGRVVGNGGSLLNVQVADLLGVGVLNFAGDGIVDGGAGRDVLGLRGYRNASIQSELISSNQYRNFEYLDMDNGWWRLEGTVATEGARLSNGATATITSANNFGTGDLTVGYGTLEVDAGTTIDLNNNIVFDPNNPISTFGVNANGDLTLSGSISGDGSVTMQGTGILRLNGQNTHTGYTGITSGILELQADNTTGTGILYGMGGVLRSNGLNGSPVNVTNSSFTLLGNIDIDTVTDLTINAPLVSLDVGNGTGFNKTGAGTLTLNGDRSGYTGTTTLTEGTINLGSNQGLGSGPLIVAGSGALSSAVDQTFTTPLTLNAGLRLEGGNAWTLNGPIDGGGLLTQASGALTINGSNTNTGGIVYGGGDLTVGASQALGVGSTDVTAANTTLDSTVDVALDNPFVLTGDLQVVSSNQVALNGSLSGPGTLIQSGTGETVLNGVNTHLGGVVVADGTLTVGNTGALGTGPVELAGGTLNSALPVLATNNTLTVSADSQIGTNGDWAWGDLNGAGDLTKIGTGSVTFGGDVSGYTGNIGVQEGSLAFLSVFDGSANVNAGALLTLGAGDDVVDGSGVISGALDLGDGNDLLNAPVGNLSNLSGSIDGNAGVDTVAIVGTGDSAWDPSNFTNFENLTVAAGANIGLTGLASFDQTTVNGGLSLGGATGGVTGDVTLEAGGTLVGPGSIGGSLTGNGTIAPSGLPGGSGIVAEQPGFAQIGVGGNLISNPGSQWIFHTSPDGTHDQIAVAGQAVLNGGQVIVLPQGLAGEYALSTVYPIITAQGGVQGAFGGVTQTTFAFLDASLQNVSTGVNLTLSRDAGGPGTDPGTDPGTPGGPGTDPGTPGGPGTPTTPGTTRYDDFAGLNQNQQNMAGALQESELRDGDARLGRLLSQVRGLTNDQVINSFDQFTGESYAGVTTAAANSQRRVMQGALRHRDPFAVGSDGVSGWVTVDRFDERLDGNNGTKRVDSTHTGVTAGFDVENGSWSWGPYLNGSKTKLDPKGRNDDLDIKSWTVGVQGQWQFDDQWWMRAAAGYGRLDVNSTRNIQIGGNAPFAVRGDTKGTTWNAGIESGWRFRNGSWTWEPMVGAYYVKTDMDSFTETGAAGDPEAALRVGGSSSTQKIVGAGLNASKEWGTQSQGKVRLDMGVRYMHNFGDRDSVVTNSFAAAPDLPFQIVGSRSNSSWVEGQVGVGYQISERAQLSAHYMADLTGDSKAKGFNVGFRWNF